MLGKEKYGMKPSTMSKRYRAVTQWRRLPILLRLSRVCESAPHHCATSPKAGITILSKQLRILGGWN